MYKFFSVQFHGIFVTTTQEELYVTMFCRLIQRFFRGRLINFPVCVCRCCLFGGDVVKKSEQVKSVSG